MSIGSELREARQAAGLSPEEVGDRTKIQPHKVEALENDQFDRLPEGIYLDGLIRAYAHEVGIDADPLIRRALVERAKFAATPGVAPEALAMFPTESQTPPASPPRPASPPPPASAPPPASVLAPTPSPSRVWLPPVSAPPPVVAAAPASKPPAAPSPPPFARVLDDSLDVSQPPPSVVKPPPVLTPIRKVTPTPAQRRRRGLALPLMTALAIAGWALAFYEANRQGMSRVRVADTIADAGSPPPAIQREEPAETRSAAPPVAETPPPNGEANASRRETDRVAGTAGTERVSRETAPPVELSIRSNVPTTAAPVSNEPTTATPPARSVSVSGMWAMAAQVERSSDPSLEGDVVGYEIQLQQAGNRISGNGRRISENGQAVGSADQVPISLSGTIQGERMTLTFIQAGSQPMTQGKLVLVVEGSAEMQGRFSSADAKSSGVIEARRMP